MPLLPYRIVAQSEVVRLCDADTWLSGSPGAAEKNSLPLPDDESGCYLSNYSLEKDPEIKLHSPSQDP